MTKFIKGKKLSEEFFTQVVKKNLDENFPELKYSAGLLGSWSEVLDFDTELSTDHHWWPRVMIFLGEKDFDKKSKISKILSQQLPPQYKGYSTHFWEPDKIGVQLLSTAKKGQAINHRVEIYTIQSYFQEYLKIDTNKKLSVFDWLTFSEQKLKTIKSGEIFYDEIGLKNIQKFFWYYPHDVWLFILASEWNKIGQEEPFVGRCGDVNDELGSRIIATRLVQSIMRLCFLMEKEYIPYSKWFGTAFSKLKSAKKFTPLLNKILSSESWKEREKYLSKAYSILAHNHNKLKITKILPIKVSYFHDRPYFVIHGEIFAEEIRKQINDKNILKIESHIGSVNQISNTVDLLENDILLHKMKNLYQ